jgi:hypothetical protein
MNATATSNVSDARPSPKFLKVINPMFRAMLKSPLARMMPSHIVVLRFSGRKSGKTYEIVTGWHEDGGEHLVFSGTKWMLNFEGGAPAEVIRGSDRRKLTGTLVRDPELIAPRLQRSIDQVGAKNIGMQVTPGHTVTPEDVRAIGRKMIVLA